MRILFGCLAFTLVSASAAAQSALTEPPDFPGVIPGPSAIHSGASCFWAASGTVQPGDVDWLQVSLPFDSTRTIVDVDFAAGSSSGLLLTSVEGGGTLFNMGDGNNAADDLCGLGSSSNPLGSVSDNALDLGATSSGIVINIGISGFADFGFAGAHAQTFDYDVWVYTEPDQPDCVTDADCDDGIDCTDDRCDPFTASCVHAADDALCDDGLFCTGVEFCDELAGCQVGAPPDCDDGIDCTIDECDEETMACFHTADDDACDNGKFCDGAETCDVLQGCLSGRAVQCDDDLDCTKDVCDDESHSCRHIPDNDLCDDGEFCDGKEICDVEEGCRRGDPPCAVGQVCDEAGTCLEADGPQLDIRPGRCPNRFNIRSHGRIRVALVGTASFDVSRVNLETLQLFRADGNGNGARPLHGRRRQRVRIKDVTAPTDNEACECSRPHADGVPDLVMKFTMPRVKRELALREIPRNENVELVLTGELLDGTPFAASDCIRLIRPRFRRRDR